MRNFLVPQSMQMDRVAGRPFFMVMASMSRDAVLALHFTQKISMVSEGVVMGGSPERNGGWNCTPRWRLRARAAASQSNAFWRHSPPTPADAERTEWSPRCGRRYAGLRRGRVDPTMNLSRDCGISATPPIAEPSAGIICGRFSVAADPAERGWTGGKPVSKRHWSEDTIGRGWTRRLSHHERGDGALCRRGQCWKCDAIRNGEGPKQAGEIRKWDGDGNSRAERFT